jgi:hypothetical protein
MRSVVWAWAIASNDSNTTAAIAAKRIIFITPVSIDIASQPVSQRRPY